MPRSKVHTFSAPDETMEMLDAIARYHQFTKSAMITALIKKEFWRIFPNGTSRIRPIEGARVLPALEPAPRAGKGGTAGRRSAR